MRTHTAPVRRHPRPAIACKVGSPYDVGCQHVGQYAMCFTPIPMTFTLSGLNHFHTTRVWCRLSRRFRNSDLGFDTSVCDFSFVSWHHGWYVLGHFLTKSPLRVAREMRVSNRYQLKFPYIQVTAQPVTLTSQPRLNSRPRVSSPQSALSALCAHCTVGRNDYGQTSNPEAPLHK